MTTKDLIPFEKGHKKVGGRKKGVKSLKATLKKWIEAEMPMPTGRTQKIKAIRTFLAENGYANAERIAIKDLLVVADILDGVRGNDKSRQRIWEYLEGKPKQPIVGDDDIPLNIKVTF